MKEESTQLLYKDELPKIEEDREEEDTPKETIKHDNKYRRSKQNRILTLTLFIATTKGLGIGDFY